MSKHKTGKYITYAIGEIVLVVIGILIALSVSNWNKKRNDAESEEIILNDLSTELKNNITALEKIINEHQKSLDAALEVRGLIKDSIKLHDISNKNLSYILKTMNYNWTYNAKLGILNSTINSGKIDLIKNKEIRYMLSSIQEAIIDANESTQEIREMRAHFYWPTVASRKEVLDYENLTFELKKQFRDPEFIWWNRFITALRIEGLEEENDLLKFLNNINSRIELELNK